MWDQEGRANSHKSTATGALPPLGQFPAGNLETETYAASFPWAVERKGADMDSSGQTELSHRVLTVIRQREECNMDELMRACSRYTWNQVFYEVDRLSRTGELTLIYKKGGDYAVKLPRSA